MRYIKVEDIEKLEGDDRLRAELLRLIESEKVQVYDLLGEVDIL